MQLGSASLLCPAERLDVAIDAVTEVAQKNVVYFKETNGDPLAVLEELKASQAVVRFGTRFFVYGQAQKFIYDQAQKRLVERG